MSTCFRGYLTTDKIATNLRVHPHHANIKFHRPYNVKRSHLAASNIWRLCLGRIRKRKRS
ncbi:hypothetical protein Vadar_022121 [Vaccinium darrowii]|uniref:Uncharacterized protein n=1 Tax=Vaccinium darrowii TaxID=229202 RepID=A0ACB7XJ58_9ERIC|nr:hypothetical protein Vadar_022121 [Vaccinium darrowii]